MLQVNSFTNKKLIREKAVSLLRYPLFTITLPFPVQRKYQAKKKPESSKQIKTVKQKRTVANNIPYRSILKKRKVSGRRAIPLVFTPIRNKEEYDKLLFVLRACDKSNNTMFTNVLRIEKIKNGSRLVATDGKRLHVTDIKSRIKPGNYKPIVNKDIIRLNIASPKINFPNWERVVPVNVTQRGYINMKNITADETNSTYYAFTKMSGEKVNPKYLADLSKTIWTIHCQSEKKKAVLLKQYGVKETYAVIMPLS